MKKEKAVFLFLWISDYISVEEKEGKEMYVSWNSDDKASALEKN